MTDRRPAAISPLEPTFDRTPAPFGAGLPDPVVCDASPRALRQRTINFAAKRLMTDMRYVSGLGREVAERHFRWRPATPPGGLLARQGPDDAAPLAAAQRDARIVIDQTTRTGGSPSPGPPRNSARRLSAARSPGQATAASSLGRIRNLPSTRSRSPAPRQRPDVRGRTAMRWRHRPRRPRHWAGHSTHFSPRRAGLMACWSRLPSACCASVTRRGAARRASPRVGP